MGLEEEEISKLTRKMEAQWVNVAEEARNAPVIQAVPRRAEGAAAGVIIATAGFAEAAGLGATCGPYTTRGIAKRCARCNS